VKRCVEGKVKKGLIWHFQGSGKSYLILFAAQKLRHEASLKAPTIVIVDDRIDLEDQITADFLGAEVENVIGAGSTGRDAYRQGGSQPRIRGDDRPDYGRGAELNRQQDECRGALHVAGSHPKGLRAYCGPLPQAD
jgi:hypothetical protein